MTPRDRRYGAWELKTGYQRWALMGLLAAVLIHLGGIAAVRYFPRPTYDGPPERLMRAVRTIPRFQPPSAMPVATAGETGDRSVPAGTVSSVPAPAADAQVEPEFTSRFEPIQLLPRLPETAPELLTDLRVGKISFRTASQQKPGLSLYDALDSTGVDYPPEVIEKVRPTYPAEGLAYLFESNLVLRVLVGLEGRVRDAFVVAGSGVDMGFEESALAAVLQWQFQPASKDGHSVPMWIDIPIAYRLFVTYEMGSETRRRLQGRVVF